MTPTNRSDARRGRWARATRRIGISVALVIAAMWSWTGLDATFQDVVDAPGKGWNIVKEMWPPDFKTVIERGAIGKIFESLYVAWIGTMIGAILSFPLSFFGASNVSPAFVPGPYPAVVQRHPRRARIDRGGRAAGRRPGSARGPVPSRSGFTRSARSASSRPR